MLFLGQLGSQQMIDGCMHTRLPQPICPASLQALLSTGLPSCTALLACSCWDCGAASVCACRFLLNPFALGPASCQT